MKATASPGPPTRWFEYALALLPLALAFTGAIGLAVGPAACALNLAVIRSSASRAVRVVVPVAIAVLAILTWGLATRLMI